MPLECQLDVSTSIFRKGLVAAIVFATVIGFTLYRVPRGFSYDDSSSGSYWKDQIKHQDRAGELTASWKSSTEITSSAKEHSNCSGDKDSQNDDNFNKVNFDINGSDVMVFLHMQKTGGTEFGYNLVANIHLEKECEVIPKTKRRRSCLRPNSDIEWWLFSRYTTGWVCGLHSDWTELHECVADKLDEIEGRKKERAYFYVTFLRHPIKRFVSEWKHVQRGATWKKSKFSCNHVENPVPICFEGDDWSGVSFNEFTSCRYNMGVNRQTRMLADLHLVNCYERWLNRNITHSRIEEIENQMLESAKQNLKELPYFGILEKQRRSQQLFEYVFPFQFKKDFVQYNVTLISDFVPTEEEMNKMIRLNHLDIKLYDYAATLFDERYERLKNCF